MSTRLDPVVEQVMEAAFDIPKTSGFNRPDAVRWMSVFPALIEAGYDLDIDAIADWLNERWRGDGGRDNRWAIKVYAWAEMALEQAGPLYPDKWVEWYIARCRNEQAE